MLGVGKVGASRCHELAAIGRAVVQTNTNTKIEASVKKRRETWVLSAVAAHLNLWSLVSSRYSSCRYAKLIIIHD